MSHVTSGTDTVYYSAESDQAISASTTYVDFTGLSANLLAGNKYEIEVFMGATADATGGYKAQYSGTVTASEIMGVSYTLAPTANTVIDVRGVINTSIVITNPAAGETNPRIISKLELTCSVSGTFKVQIAQRVASGTTTFLKRSFMRVRTIP